MLKDTSLRARFAGSLIVLAALTSGCGTTPTPVDTFSTPRLWDGGRRFEHVLIIVLENQTYEEVLNDKAAPVFAELAGKGVSFTDFHGLFHPSYPNYLAMISGQLLMTEGDTQQCFAFRTIADLAADPHGKTLTCKNYAEGYPGLPSKRFPDDFHGRYARKHVPFMSFPGTGDKEREIVVNADQFDKDLAANDLPQYMYYSPDLDHDGHDPTWPWPVSIGRRKSAVWLKDFLDRRFPEADRKRTKTLTVITYDESAGGLPANHIYTVFLGDMLKPSSELSHGERDRAYNHFNVLRTIEDNFGLVKRLGDGDRQAAPILDIWR